ncbi:MAG TPA: transferrin receptor-like dimerization domain-containing protein [Bryobacteraceae bacterium]|nr:transferrin receptor-like dimerization domain-containing protein [Bryobacteraceae bacterium]
MIAAALVAGGKCSTGGFLRHLKAFAVFALTFGISARQPASAPLLGFNPQSTKTELNWEQRFRAIPDAKRVHANMTRLAAHPHNVGSEDQKKNAEWLVARYKEWGWDAHIEQFDVLYPTPKTRVLELVGSGSFKAKLEEPPLPDDPYTKEKSTQLPGFNIYSADGDVTAPLVYVNYGMLNDYDELERNGISVKGAIVISRYGGGWRGLKPKLAYEHGAVGCIIYSDPADDGYVQGDILPKGPMRPPGGIQRGSVADATLYAGDPLTPDIGSVPGAKRLKISEAKTLMRIPVLPVGYGDAQPFLEALDGRVVPAAWRGGLPLTYHFGPGPAKVHLKLAFNWEQKPVLDVIATMKGSEEPDVWIVRGNHYDGWVNGANDPISGQSALLEEARALGELAKQGWRPKRTLIYTAWDGEEPGLLGSTEWGETHAEELSKHVALYLNTDETGRGFLGAGGSHSLEQLVNDVAKDIMDPETKVPVWKRQQAAALLQGGRRPRAGRGNSEESASRQTLPLEAIGSGSDFSVFLDHLGIASLNLGFGGEDRSGTYHSAYDTPWFEDKFGDKSEAYGVALAQTAGTLIMRMAGADILPYDFTILTNTLKGYDSDLKALVKSLQGAAELRKRNIDMGLYALVNDPQNPVHAPGPLAAPPNMDFSGLDNAIADLGRAAVQYRMATTRIGSLAPEKRRALNAELALAERHLTSEQGLPGRPWIRHLLYAPGTYTGYGAKTIPGVREALEQGRYQEAQEQLALVSKALTGEAALIEQLAEGFAAAAQ